MELEILKEIRLLYVEDDESIRRVLSRGLKRRVKELCVAVDGKDGLEQYDSFKPDIIVTDIKMPNMSGLEMAKRIKQENSSIPIIITSAHGETDTLLEAIETGISGYILKPIDKDKLFNTIYTHAKSLVLEKELECKNKQLIQQSKNAALGELIENIAHQWRQPLSVISTIAGSIQLKNEFGMIDKEFLNESTERLSKVTKKLSDTIDYFRSTFVLPGSNKEEFFLQSSIDSAMYSIENEIDENKIVIFKNIDPSLSLKNYPNLFLQSIMHLVRNSIDALESSKEEKRYIFIDILKENEELIVKVKDTAGGIDDDIIDHIFEPYFTTHHKCEGKGLGLHMVLHMVEDGMGGTIDVENCEFEYEGDPYKGALFTIRLK